MQVLAPQLTKTSGLDYETKEYNNIVEFGPGIAFTPNNRYDVVIRGEFARGYYLPVDDPSNPFSSSWYDASLIVVETYFSF